MLGFKIAERNEREGPETDQRKGTSNRVLTKPTSPGLPVSVDEAQMCSGLKLGPLIWKESSRRRLASIPDEKERGLNVVNCMKWDLSDWSCGRFLEGGEKHRLWSMEVTSGFSVRFYERKPPSRGQSIPQPAEDFWNPRTCVTSFARKHCERRQPANTSFVRIRSPKVDPVENVHVAH